MSDGLGQDPVLVVLGLLEVAIYAVTERLAAVFDRQAARVDRPGGEHPGGRDPLASPGRWVETFAS